MLFILYNEKKIVEIFINYYYKKEEIDFDEVDDEKRYFDINRCVVGWWMKEEVFYISLFVKIKVRDIIK